MSDERDVPDPKMVALIVEAVARQVANVGQKELVDAPPVITGRDAAAISRTVALAIDDELSRRRVLSDAEIRAIAKEVAHEIVEKSMRDLRELFLTEDEIEAIVLRILKDAGIKADEKHAEATRETVEGLFRSYKRRSEYGSEFIKELIKALALLIVGATLAYVGVKGVPR